MRWGQQINGTPGSGVTRGATRQFVIKIDHETADEVIARAAAAKCSTAEMIRCLIEWGLSIEEQD